MSSLPLAAYACDPGLSKGRRYEEQKDSSRTEYQRDRDRIVHSGAFRRLEYKTQVFVNHEGDLFRTRLTHSIEVAQIGRSVARNLRLNEDLTEAISLAHDLGHTPFGHAGQDALNECMKEYGGFEHNLQSLRVVDVLEERYGTFDGLNLTFETREGILKHCSKEDAAKLGDVGERFLKDKRPSLEAQLANVADEIAYNNHDVDDGLRSGLLTVAQLTEIDLFAKYWFEVQKLMPGINERRAIYETIRRMIGALIVDLTKTSLKRIEEVDPQSILDVRNAPLLIAFSDEMGEKSRSLKQFLFQNLYRHYQVNRMSSKARRIIQRLFTIFMAEPQLLAPEHRANSNDKYEQARKIADYIAGMTDRYAMRQYRKLYEIEEV
ncbi:deoxyguanosinetriphosphate triphosphohydrolase [Oxalobacter formigenes]|uniref:Deoxyguanosinetriphosphate triphosphohydrolase-like protein n=1 Tax=Oxalobacter formigenes OXCC13 TaxID=556269 RepID=C3XCS6_OXAFO|nr:deoxyguanosinetriphosphate triphosphohydrolase [Oxalobacter formigenes]ARQ44816.1 Deoxyguanosinetriphosphate triphosphohydrolase-like protein [Oxalobacter formigenes]ARQ79087.1 deoxyguanosinetriphosphate triphosphohydrolase [Oxalobacter formigenes OXCC13]EEO31002.1 putative dGTPase [Oxalobacter formigenes OXCC13]MCZ4063566.1 deoxyguanosinetriphosphate triphosphohydrolase [Oxalobacter formigenes]QDX32317.1 deoxyguanosinetriphosphate triphosphohydrolase [Oxalobacter formigenes]